MHSQIINLECTCITQEDNHDKKADLLLEADNMNFYVKLMNPLGEFMNTLAFTFLLYCFENKTT